MPESLSKDKKWENIQKKEIGPDRSVSNMSRIMMKPMFWFPTWSDTNQAVQQQKMARGLKFQI